MTKISNKLLKKFKHKGNNNILNLKEYTKSKKIGNERLKSVKDAKQLINDGYDPLHAIYMSTQNVVSLFAEIVSDLPELDEYYKIFCDSEDEYMPDGPPFSPLTRSYFTTWTFFDVIFGEKNETIGSCIIDLNKKLDYSIGIPEAIENFQQSRMGIYEHCGFKNSKRVVLTELVTGDKKVCFVPSGYLGKKGELWFARVVPPINNLFDYHVVFTTPYILLSQKNQWIEYFDRTLNKNNITFKYLLKYGLDLNYWNEYIFLSYFNSQYSVIFLKGIPDIKKSLPHA